MLANPPAACCARSGSPRADPAERVAWRRSCRQVLQRAAGPAENLATRATPPRAVADRLLAGRERAVVVARKVAATGGRRRPSAQAAESVILRGSPGSLTRQQ